MSLYLQNRGSNLSPLKKLVNFDSSPENLIEELNFQDVLKSMARGCLIELCEPETIDNNPKHSTLPGASPSTLETMKSEMNRLKSYNNRWTLEFLQPSDLAAVGLFYLGVSDNVQCAFCHGIISDWDEGDNPLEEHVRHFPMCPYLMNCDVGNVPISGVNGQQKWQTEPSRSECGRCVREQVARPQLPLQSFRPKHPSMGSFDRRLDTYRNWPSSAPLTPIQLAEAGLFYSGVADVATCFSCGGSMGNWSPEDQAWTEHAKHFPHCEYVKCIKGSHFPESIRQPSPVPAVAAANSCSEAAKNEDAAVMVEAQMLEETVVTENSPAASSSSQNSMENKTSPASSNVKYTCKICMDEGNRVVFVPCGHSLACSKCAANLKTCPLCRKHIETSVRLFFDE